MHIGHTPRRLVAVVATVCGAVCGCANGDDAMPEIRPIDEIVIGEVRVVPVPSGTAATVEVDTDVPVACAIIYGSDESFGSIATDSDMQGGAHREHSPLLTGLEPDTEYRFVLQGSDAAGTIYRSDVMTFRTPPAVDTGLGPNVAAAATVTAVSSSFSDDFAAERAVDGDLGTEWSSAGDGDDAWIEIDLGEDLEIAAVTLRTRQMSDGTAIIETYTVSVDGTMLGPFTAGPDPVLVDDPVTGRVVRFDAANTTGGNTGAVEVEVYIAAGS